MSLASRQREARKRAEQKAKSTEVVPSGPFLDWLERTDRRGWTNRLTDTQQRYVERLLDRRPDRVNIHSADGLLTALDLPWLLHSLYPEDRPGDAAGPDVL